MQTYSVWARPAAKDSARFQAVIDALCHQQNVPPFVPHMTLGGLSETGVDFEAVLSALLDLTLTPTEIVETPLFTKSLFVRFAISQGLQAGRRALEALPSFRAGRGFDPHLSLCYGRAEDRAALAQEIEALASKPVRFDRLALVRITLPVECHDDLETWQMVSEHQIPG